jgi:hypothetical protein
LGIVSAAGNGEAQQDKGNKGNPSEHSDHSLGVRQKNALPDRFVGQGISVSQDVQAETFSDSPFELILGCNQPLPS